MQSTNRTPRRLAVLLPAFLWVLLIGVICTLNALAETQDSDVPQPPDVDSIESIESIEEDSSDSEDEDDWEWSDDWDDRDSDAGDVVRVGDDVEIAPGRRVRGDVVAIGGKVVMRGEAAGDVVAIGGNVTISGHVSGDVVAVGGGVYLESGAVVDGDAVSVGGKVHREEGVILRGQEVNVSVFPFDIGGWLGCGRGGTSGPSCGEMRAFRVGFELSVFIGFLLVGLVLILAFPERMMTVHSTLRSQFWLSLVAGFGSVLGVIVMLVLLMITCIGILIAIPGFLLWILAIIGGGAVAVAILGGIITRKPITNNRSLLSMMLIGIALLFGLHLLGRLLGFAGGVGDPVGSLLIAVSGLIWFVLLTAGFGALVLSRLGKRVPGTVPAIPPPPPYQPGTPPPPAPPASGTPPTPTP